MRGALTAVAATALLAGCASDREALDRIDARLAGIESRLATLEERVPPPQPTIWVPSAWPLDERFRVRVPTVRPEGNRLRILDAGGCVLPVPLTHWDTIVVRPPDGPVPPDPAPDAPPRR